jgi:hypothetical protein
MNLWRRDAIGAARPECGEPVAMAFSRSRALTLTFVAVVAAGMCKLAGLGWAASLLFALILVAGSRLILWWLFEREWLGRDDRR